MVVLKLSLQGLLGIGSASSHIYIVKTLRLHQMVTDGNAQINKENQT